MRYRKIFRSLSLRLPFLSEEEQLVEDISYILSIFYHVLSENMIMNLY